LHIEGFPQFHQFKHLIFEVGGSPLEALYVCSQGLEIPGGPNLAAVETAVLRRGARLGCRQFGLDIRLAPCDIVALRPYFLGPDAQSGGSRCSSLSSLRCARCSR
jgi:hypothetical protein